MATQLDTARNVARTLTEAAEESGRLSDGAACIALLEGARDRVRALLRDLDPRERGDVVGTVASGRIEAPSDPANPTAEIRRIAIYYKVFNALAAEFPAAFHDILDVYLGALASKLEGLMAPQGSSRLPGSDTVSPPLRTPIDSALAMLLTSQIQPAPSAPESDDRQPQ